MLSALAGRAAGLRACSVLHNKDNRAGDQLKDASGAVAHNIAPVRDALNRVPSATGARQ